MARKSGGFGTFKRPIARTSKARRTDAEGTVKDSVFEMQRHGQLKLLERAGEIRNLRCQVPYSMVVNGVAIRRPWPADFVYEELDRRDRVTWRLVVEDTKQFDTDGARWTRNLMLAIHGITVKLVKRI